MVVSPVELPLCCWWCGASGEAGGASDDEEGSFVGVLSEGGNE
jgi:hypothetical protein